MKFFMCFDKVEEMKHEGNGKRNKMKKRIVILISVGICTLFFTGCAEEDREVLTSQQASSPLSTVSHEASKRSNQVSIELPQQTYSMDTEKIVFTIRNTGTEGVAYGAGDIKVEVQKDGMWHLISYGSRELDQRYLPAGDAIRGTVALQADDVSQTITGTVPETETAAYDYHPGHYRIVFETPEIGWTSAEFNLIE